MSTELVKISADDRGNPAVCGRELHAVLEIETRYDTWFQRMVEYGFTEGKDFEILVAQKRATNNPRNPWTEITDHILSIDMAKHLAMIQRTEKGKAVRQYFIECEKAYRERPAIESERSTI